jgi:Zn-dependent peptidase ImmA (M78 family)
MIKPPYLAREEIWRKAEAFRREYVHPLNLIPVPIIEIVELRLKIEIRTIRGLLENIDVDGFLTKDLKSLCIDEGIYMDPRKEARLRFTFAHEIGHLVLHRAEIGRCHFRTPEDWMRFRDDFNEDSLSWFEHQAYEFAGRLLAPKEILNQEVAVLKPKAAEFRRNFPGEEDMLLQAIARLICNRFKVSADVIARRIKKENIKLE